MADEAKPFVLLWGAGEHPGNDPLTLEPVSLGPRSRFGSCIPCVRHHRLLKVYASIAVA